MSVLLAGLLDLLMWQIGCPKGAILEYSQHNTRRADPICDHVVCSFHDDTELSRTLAINSMDASR